MEPLVIDGYCLSCKQRQVIKDAELIETPHPTKRDGIVRQARGVCSAEKCGKKMTTFVKKEIAERFYAAKKESDGDDCSSAGASHSFGSVPIHESVVEEERCSVEAECADEC